MEERFSSLRRVTSDSKPWAFGGRLGTCEICQTVQKPVDAEWLAEIDAIYRDYEIYHQGGGREQMYFPGGGDVSKARSERIVECLVAEGWIDQQGRALDVGCGNGAMLRSLSKQLPGWRLAGTELDEKYKQDVEAIPRVGHLYTCSVGEIPGHFDLITLVHVLEHIPTPTGLLRDLVDRLVCSSHLFVQVPHLLRNPFDVLIADHCSHFTGDSLSRFVESSGYRVEGLSQSWISKELSLVSSTDGSPTAGGEVVPSFAAEACVNWLYNVKEAALTVQADGAFGIFGTTIASTWLYSEIPDRVDFFVDEDPNRVGRSYRGLPVIHPNHVVPGSSVFLALPSHQAESIAQRLTQHRETFSTVCPPNFRECGFTGS